MSVDVMEILADWQQFRRTESGASVRTSCILPSGSLLSVSIQPAIEGWIVCDEGSVVSDALSHGYDVDVSLPGLSSKVKKIGLYLEKGKIYSERVSSAELPYMVAYLATAALDASKWLLNHASKIDKNELAYELKRIINIKFNEYRMTEPLSILGNSSKNYSFDNVLILPNKQRLILDPVTRHDGSIKSKLVANLDVSQASHANLVQRIVYDSEEEWEHQELSLLGVGAPTVRLSKVSEVIDRMVA